MRCLIVASLAVGAVGCTPDFDPLDPSLGGSSGDGGGSASGAASATGGSGTGAAGTGGNTGSGGTVVGDGTPGSPCVGNGNCASDFCVDDVCCQSACTELCAVCSGVGSDGQCTAAPKSTEEPGCEITEACGGGTIESCKLKAGQSCQNNGQCLNMCSGGTCD